MTSPSVQRTSHSQAVLEDRPGSIDCGQGPRGAHSPGIHDETTETSMLDTPVRAALARELHDAERTRVQVEHFSKRHPAMTIEDSYAIQREWIALKRAEGRVAV